MCACSRTNAQALDCAPIAQTLLASSDCDISAARIYCSCANNSTTAPYDPDDSFALVVQLNRFHFDIRRTGRLLPSCSFGAGAVGIYDLESRWEADLRTAFDFMHFHISRAALDKVADDMDARRIAGICCKAHDGVIDPVLLGLSQALAPSLTHPENANRLFLDHVLLAIGAHTAQFYGGMEPRSRAARGGLAPWQLRHLMEFMNANLSGDFKVAELAAECGLSAGHLIRAFRISTGSPPYRWLTQRRVEKAKDLLLTSGLSVAEIANACGFVDQSHFTKVFAKVAGMPPAAWVRSRRN